MNETLEISADEFRLWLEARRGDIVGKPRYGCDCPFANWLRGKLGCGVIVGLTAVRLGIGGGKTERQALPRWAAAFVDEVDRDTGFLDGETALSILAGALREGP